MLSRAIPLSLSLAAALLAGCLADETPASGDASALTVQGRIGEPCAQLAWHGDCDRGLTCTPAPDGRLDSVCSHACTSDAQCGPEGACYEGGCIAQCGAYGWPWACPYGTEAITDGGACVCIPGRPRPVGYDGDEAP